MNKVLALSCTALLAFACTTANAQTPARNASGAPVPMQNYGAKITPDGAISTSDFAKSMQVKEKFEGKVVVPIITSCQKKGCWMDVQLPNKEVMKVKFLDYAFFVPTEGLEGKTAILNGVATKETIDVATLQHYAEDAGKTKEEIAQITEPRTEITFLADGVLIGD
ncbi:MAG: DUF4920 domain-containing protein [Flavobacteriales bacterium]|nr:DUF4920 domain-containing protein [Flavobacteriales bacterium]